VTLSLKKKNDRRGEQVRNFRILVGVLLLFTAGLAQAVTTGSLDEGDYLGIDFDDGSVFLMDVFNLGVLGVPSIVTITMEGSDTLAPWLYLLGEELVTPASPQTISLIGFTIASANDQIGGVASLSFVADANVFYQIVATSTAYYDGSTDTLGDFGEYTLTVEIDPLQVQPVPLPAGVWLLGSALGFAGMLSRRRDR
jgi:hypothetical protein